MLNRCCIFYSIAFNKDVLWVRLQVCTQVDKCNRLIKHTLILAILLQQSNEILHIWWRTNFKTWSVLLIKDSDKKPTSNNSYILSYLCCDDTLSKTKCSRLASNDSVLPNIGQEISSRKTHAFSWLTLSDLVHLNSMHFTCILSEMSHVHVAFCVVCVPFVMWRTLMTFSFDGASDYLLLFRILFGKRL